MTTGHKLLLVRLISSDSIELGLRFSTRSSELDIELGLSPSLTSAFNSPPSLISAFVSQLVADLPSQEVKSKINQMCLLLNFYLS